MPRVQREANVTWEGNVARGNGTISAGTGAFERLPYSLATRIERIEGRTSPEELLAGAHAACFAMSLAGELATVGSAPEHLDVEATVTLDQLEVSIRALKEVLSLESRTESEARRVEVMA